MGFGGGSFPASSPQAQLDVSRWRSCTAAQGWSQQSRGFSSAPPPYSSKKSKREGVRKKFTSHNILSIIETLLGSILLLLQVFICCYMFFIKWPDFTLCEADFQHRCYFWMSLCISWVLYSYFFAWVLWSRFVSNLQLWAQSWTTHSRLMCDLSCLISLLCEAGDMEVSGYNSSYWRRHARRDEIFQEGKGRKWVFLIVQITSLCSL